MFDAYLAIVFETLLTIYYQQQYITLRRNDKKLLIQDDN